MARSRNVENFSAQLKDMFKQKINVDGMPAEKSLFEERLIRITLKNWFMPYLDLGLKFIVTICLTTVKLQNFGTVPFKVNKIS